VLTLWLT